MRHGCRFFGAHLGNAAHTPMAAHKYLGSFHASRSPAVCPWAHHLLCLRAGGSRSAVPNHDGLCVWGGKVVTEHLGQLFMPPPGILICALHPVWSKPLVQVVGPRSG